MSWDRWELLITSLIALSGVYLGSWLSGRGNQKLHNKQTRANEIKTNYILVRNIRSIEKRLERLSFFYEAMDRGSFQEFNLDEDFQTGIEKIEYFMENIDSLDYHHFSMSYIKELQELLHFLDNVVEESYTYLNYDGMEDYYTDVHSKINNAKLMCRDFVTVIVKDIEKK